MDERRSHRRFGVALPIQVWREGMPIPIDAHFRDLSWGGASFTTGQGLKIGEHLVVRFPWAQGESLAIEAEVLRSREIKPGYWEIGVRFIHLAHSHERRLTQLLKLLAGKGGDPAGSSRLPLAPVLEIVLNDDEEFADKLLQIAQGHLSLTIVGSGYQAGQSLLLLLSQAQDSSVLAVRAHIKQALEIAPLDPFSAVGRPPIMDLELHIAHPLNELHRLTEAFRSHLGKRRSSP